MQACGQGNTRRDGLRALLHPVLQMRNVVEGVFIGQLRCVQRSIEFPKFPLPAWEAAFLTAILGGHAVQFIEFLLNQIGFDQVDPIASAQSGLIVL